MELAAHTHLVIISLSIIETAIISLTLKVQLAVSLFHRLPLLNRLALINIMVSLHFQAIHSLPARYFRKVHPLTGLAQPRIDKWS